MEKKRDSEKEEEREKGGRGSQEELEKTEREKVRKGDLDMQIESQRNVYLSIHI